MEYLLLYRNGTDPQPFDPAEGTIAEWIADVEARGVGEYGERLRPGRDSTTVRVRNAEVLVSEGPFTEAREWVAGFDVIDCADLDEAIGIASKHPGARIGTVEVRPFMVWPDARPDDRIVPPGFVERTTDGSRYVMFVCVDPSGETDGDDDVDAWVDEMAGRGVRCSARPCARRRTPPTFACAEGRRSSVTARSPSRRSGSPGLTCSR